jgi:hypothetical protein
MRRLRDLPPLQNEATFWAELLELSKKKRDTGVLEHADLVRLRWLAWKIKDINLWGPQTPEPMARYQGATVVSREVVNARRRAAPALKARSL